PPSAPHPIHTPTDATPSPADVAARLQGPHRPTSSSGSSPRSSSAAALLQDPCWPPLRFISGRGVFFGEGSFVPVSKGFVGDIFKKGVKPQAIAVKLLVPDGTQSRSCSWTPTARRLPARFQWPCL
ncbi:unnamed protein product, partial [Urochloa humidicola]